MDEDIAVPYWTTFSGSKSGLRAFSPFASTVSFWRNLELIAETGPAQDDLEPLFATLAPDAERAWDGVRDPDTLPLVNEPAELIAEIDRIAHRS